MQCAASNLQWMGQMCIFNERVLGNLLNLNLFIHAPRTTTLVAIVAVTVTNLMEFMLVSHGCVGECKTWRVGPLIEHIPSSAP